MRPSIGRVREKPRDVWSGRRAKAPTKRDAWPAERRESLAASGGVGIRRLEPNVLTLDYVDVTAGGVKALKSTVRSANWNRQFVAKAVTAALKEMVRAGGAYDMAAVFGVNDGLVSNTSLIMGVAGASAGAPGTGLHIVAIAN